MASMRAAVVNQFEIDAVLDELRQGRVDGRAVVGY